MFSKKSLCKELTEIYVIKYVQKKFGIFMHLFIFKIK